MRRLLLLTAIGSLGYLAYRRARGRRTPEPESRPSPAPSEPGGPIPRSAGAPGLAAGELQEGVWPGQAEGLIRARYPVLGDEDFAVAGNDLEKLAAIAAERTHQPVHQVYEDLLGTAREASPLEQDRSPL
jgi:hypothetical protein